MTPFKTNIGGEFKFREYIRQTRMQLVDIVSENTLMNLFRKIINLMQTYCDGDGGKNVIKKSIIVTKPKETPSNKKLNSSLNTSKLTNSYNSFTRSSFFTTSINRFVTYENELLTFNISQNGYVSVSVSADKNKVTIVNHLGDLSTLATILNANEQQINEMKKTKFENQSNEFNKEFNPVINQKLQDIKLIKNFGKLIQLCFESLIKNQIEYEAEPDDIFQV